MTSTTAVRRGSGVLVDPARLAIWLFLGVVAMLFAAFASAYLIRMASGDWIQVRLPGILWLNTVVLVVSSVALELARMRSGALGRRWVGATAALGALFLAGQIVAWSDLVRQGVFVPTSPHSAFFYILTGLHGLHLLGGLAYLGYVWVQIGSVDAARAAWLERQAATYWHFMGGLWVFLFAMLHLG